MSIFSYTVASHRDLVEGLPEDIVDPPKAFQNIPLRLNPAIAHGNGLIDSEKVPTSVCTSRQAEMGKRYYSHNLIYHIYEILMIPGTCP